MVARASRTGFRLDPAPQRIFGEFHYRAGSWPCHRRMIAKAEHNAQGPNPRFVVTNLRDEPRALYETMTAPTLSRRQRKIQTCARASAVPARPMVRRRSSST